MKKGFYGLNTEENRPRKVIVSLTSYPPRLPTLHLCIKSLLRQTYKPDKLILYLSNDVILDDLKNKLIKLVDYGLTIENAPENIKPHKKYYYAMQQYPDDIIITVDDDAIYNKDLISLLMQSYNRYPDAVSATRVHKILSDDGGNLKKYNKWEYNCKNTFVPSTQLFATGVGGVLYPPHCMDNELFRIDKIKELCLHADDIWLKIMQIRYGTKVVLASNRPFNRYRLIIIAQKGGLFYENLFKCANDACLAKVMQEYNIQPVDFFKENI